MPRLMKIVLLSAAALCAQANVPVTLSGTVTDSAGVALAGAAVRLDRGGLTATSGADGKFTLTGTTAIMPAAAKASLASIREGGLFLTLPAGADVDVVIYGMKGEVLSTLHQGMQAGDHAIPLEGIGTGVRFFRVSAGAYATVLKAVALDGALRSTPIGPQDPAALSALSKEGRAAAAYYDVITSVMAGYQKAYLSINASDASNLKIKMLKTTTPKFSFFVTSMKAMLELSGSKDGFGGDFTFGETGAGAGLRGADKLCAAIAERSFPGAASKGWRAFLSVTADAYGKQVDAIDRIGEGPWYDRTGRVVAPTKADLLAVRPKNGDPSIQLDLPNENGIPNHQPDPSKPKDDNHHTITGSNDKGKLKSATATCKDWTTKDGSAANGQPSAGFSWPRGGQVSNSGSNWMTTWDAPGCAAGIEIADAGAAPPGSIIIGGGGGYGGFYCFALNP
jgi:hypothetical protein